MISQNQEFEGFTEKGGDSLCNGPCFTKKLTTNRFSKELSLYNANYYWKVRADNTSWSNSPQFKTASEKNTYQSDKAATYAAKNYLKSYPKETPFFDYTEWKNANCTHFASQSVLAGFLGTTEPQEVFDNKKTRFDSTGSYQWYYYSGGKASSSWKGAKEFFSYVQKQNGSSNFQGPHFKFVTKDSAKKSLDVNSVKEGDIVFADWPTINGEINKLAGTPDGKPDHTMIVTTNKEDRSYSGIDVAYQSSPGVDPKKRSLSSVNDLMRRKAIFYVYRPTHFIP